MSWYNATESRGTRDVAIDDDVMVLLTLLQIGFSVVIAVSLMSQLRALIVILDSLLHRSLSANGVASTNDC